VTGYSQTRSFGSLCFSEELRAIHRKRGMLPHARTVHDFSPLRLETKAKRFKLHNFRGTAMSEARMAGVAERLAFKGGTALSGFNHT
jgi:hypothetical protein